MCEWYDGISVAVSVSDSNVDFRQRCMGLNYDIRTAILFKERYI